MVDDASELQDAWFDGKACAVGVTAGAPAPEDLVQGVVIAGKAGATAAQPRRRA